MVSTDPYWWQAAPRPTPPLAEVPAKVDVAVVGSGFTGLNAALPLARAGRSVAVFDAGLLGQGASTRNAGYIGRSLKHRFVDLMAAEGLERAVAVYREMQAAFDAVVGVIRDEGIDCGLRRGRFQPAASAAHYADFVEEFEAQRKHLGIACDLLPAERVREELGTDLYAGGVAFPDLAGIHPGLYHAGLLRRVEEAGVALLSETPVRRILSSEPGAIRLSTPRGEVVARNVVIATNGYTDGLVPWLRRRLIPFDAFMIATERLAPERLDRALPGGKVTIDSNHNPLFVRPSPDGHRILFGALTGTSPSSPMAKGRDLADRLQRLLPDLVGVGFEVSWTGRCAATFDLYPHAGIYENLHYAVGYCFAGVPMGTHLGQVLARSVAAGKPVDSVFAREFPTRPLYSGRPWFVPALLAWYRLQDRRTASGALAA